jgi:hypothetical protein
MNDTASSPAPSTGTGVKDAAAAFEAILSGGDAGEQEQPKRQREASPPEADEAEAPSAETDDELQASEEDDGGEDEGEAEPAEGEEGDEEPIADDELLTVTIDGKVRQITAKELAEGYLRTVDYTRKTQALAEERRQFAQLNEQRAQFQSEVEEVRQERAYYQQALSQLSQVLNGAQEQNIDWDRLYAEDPIEWVKQKELQRTRQETQQAAQLEMQRLQAQQANEAKGQLAQHVKAERGKLLEAIPTWKDEKVWERDRVALRAYGKRLGFSDQELSQAYDHRAIVALYKAMKLDAMTAAGRNARPNPPRTLAQPTRTSGLSAPRPVTEATRAKQRHAKTGKVKDAAAVFESLL